MVEEIKLGRVGHYHIPGAEGSEGTCQTATVSYVHSPTMVNVSAIEHNGDEIHGHTSVPVRGFGEDPGPGATFHLNRACPFEK